MAPHVRFAIVPMLGAAARVGAILDLRWARVDFAAGVVDLCADDAGPRKGRAVVPMSGMVRAALTSARALAVCEHVIAWGGRPVSSIKREFTSASAAARLEDATPHVLRHTAAVHMAAEGVPMTRKCQYLGHSNTTITERTFARFAPHDLRDAAAALDFTGPRLVRLPVRST